MPMPRIHVLAEEQIADEIALHHGEASTLLEVGDGDAHRRLVDEIVGNDHALEGELGIKGDLAHPGAGIADHLAVGARIGADGGEGAIGDAVCAHQHRACPEHIDTIAVLAAPAALGGDALDAVGGDEGAVLAGFRAPDENAVVAAIAHVIVADLEA